MTQNRKDEQAVACAAAGPDAPSFLPVPVRARHDGWTPERQRAFVEHLADTGSVREAATLVGMTEQSAWRLRRRTGAAGFGAAWDAALRQAMRQLVASALERAIQGTIVRRFYHGELIAEERVHSERLLIHLLGRADTLLGGGAGAASDAVLADWHGWMERLERGELEHNGRLWQDRRGVWMTSYPAPAGFGGYSEREPGDPAYCRTLTQWEADRVEAVKGARLDDAAADRDRFFGRAPNARLNRSALSKSRR